MVTWWPAGGGAFLQQHCHQRGPGLEGTLVTAGCTPECRGTGGSVYENEAVACGRTAEGMMGVRWQHQPWWAVPGWWPGWAMSHPSSLRAPDLQVEAPTWPPSNPFLDCTCMTLGRFCDLSQPSLVSWVGGKMKSLCQVGTCHLINVP